MNRFILFLAGGNAYFAGLLLLAVGCWLGRHARRLARITATLAALAGVILIVASTTPVPIFWYALLVVSVVLWLLAIRTRKFSERWTSNATRLMLLTIASGLILEVPYVLSPRIAQPERRRLIILADSITAGVRDGEQTWPMRLRQHVDYEILDRSHVGAVIADASEMLSSVTLDGDLVLIELGGNDLLGNTSPREFHQGLDTLLEHLDAANCSIVMFELPLPPISYQFGYSQRELAARYAVALIPKRYLLSVLVGEQKTLDSIHLTEAGHQQLAGLVEELLAPAMRAKARNE